MNPTRHGMVAIQGGATRIGSDSHYPEEAPVRIIDLAGFWIDPTPVTNAEFAEFVRATDYRTLAETAPSHTDYPDMPPEMAIAGSAVFVQPSVPTPANDPSLWWAYRFGANWRHPYGPCSGIDDIPDHPVVHIAYADALAFAEWKGKALPTEAEWEHAARGGLVGAAYAWGDEFEPHGRPQANYWQGRFPWENTLKDGYARTSPVRAFPPNGYGLYDMIGNVWEWTTDWFDANPPSSKCCAPSGLAAPRKVIKGGSHLCAENYCRRYRPAARHPQAIDSPTSHIGFRCVWRG